MSDDDIDIGIGNKLYRATGKGIHSLLTQIEMANFMSVAIQHIRSTLQQDAREELEVDSPIGYGIDKRPILVKRTYTKEQMLEAYGVLHDRYLPVNEIAQIVIIVDATFSELIRTVLTEQPKKIGADKKISFETVLSAASIDELQQHVVDRVVRSLGYDSPEGLAAQIEKILSIDLMTCPAFHRYMELKATRDVLVHNNNIANETYRRKAGSHARTQKDELLVVDIHYFLEGFETVISLIEWVQIKLHSKWHSSECEQRLHEAKQAQAREDAEEQAPPPTQATPEELESIDTTAPQTPPSPPDSDAPSGNSA